MEQAQDKIYKVPEYTRRAINRYQEKNKEKILEYAKTHSKINIKMTLNIENIRNKKLARDIKEIKKRKINWINKIDP